MSDTKHAILSPSSAARWTNCPGSVALCKDIPNTTSEYAEEGTYAHAIAAADLTRSPRPGPIDREQHDYIKAYTTAVEAAAQGKFLLVEQRLPISRWTGEADAKGTADAIIIDAKNATVEVWDLKFGQGHVVIAENNEQLMLYALGVLGIVEGIFLDKVTVVKLVIHQPRRDHISEWCVDRQTLIDFGEKASQAGLIALAARDSLTSPDNLLHPSEKACLWCPAKATCPALAAKVQSEVFDDFDTVDIAKPKQISASNLPSAEVLTLVEEWIKAAKAKISEQLNNRIPVPGWKLTLGRQGNRTWSDGGKVEELVKAMRIKDAFIHELKSPAQIEKLIPPKKFKKLADLITRADAKPIPVPSSDPRPEYVPATEGEFNAFI